MTLSTRPCADCGRPFTAGPYAMWGLCCRWKHRGRVAQTLWTPERDALIRQRYDSHVRGRAAVIGRAIGLPSWRVKRRAQELGLARPRSPWRAWRPEELAFLEAHAGRRRDDWIAKQLGRSLTSVVMRLKHARISRRVRDGYGMRELEECLGLDHRRIRELVESGRLRAAHRGAPHDRWLFTDEDVRDFVQRNPSAFRLDRVDQLWFLDLVFSGRIGEADRPGRRDDREAA